MKNTIKHKLKDIPEKYNPLNRCDSIINHWVKELCIFFDDEVKKTWEEGCHLILRRKVDGIQRKAYVTTNITNFNAFEFENIDNNTIIIWEDTIIEDENNITTVLKGAFKGKMTQDYKTATLLFNFMRKENNEVINLVTGDVRKTEYQKELCSYGLYKQITECNLVALCFQNKYTVGAINSNKINNAIKNKLNPHKGNANFKYGVQLCFSNPNKYTEDYKTTLDAWKIAIKDYGYTGNLKAFCSLIKYHLNNGTELRMNHIKGTNFGHVVFNRCDINEVDQVEVNKIKSMTKEEIHAPVKVYLKRSELLALKKKEAELLLNNDSSDLNDTSSDLNNSSSSDLNSSNHIIKLCPPHLNSDLLFKDNKNFKDLIEFKRGEESTEMKKSNEIKFFTRSELKKAKITSSQDTVDLKATRSPATASTNDDITNKGKTILEAIKTSPSASYSVSQASSKKPILTDELFVKNTVKYEKPVIKSEKRIIKINPREEKEVQCYYDNEIASWYYFNKNNIPIWLE